MSCPCSPGYDQTGPSACATGLCLGDCCGQCMCVDGTCTTECPGPGGQGCPGEVVCGSDAGTCVQCISGHFSPSGCGLCQVCPANTWSGQGYSSCTSCPEGTCSPPGSTSSFFCFNCPSASASPTPTLSATPVPTLLATASTTPITSGTVSFTLTPTASGTSSINAPSRTASSHGQMGPLTLGLVAGSVSSALLIGGCFWVVKRLQLRKQQSEPQFMASGLDDYYELRAT